MRLIEHAPRKEAKFLHTLVPITESIVPLDKWGKRRWRRFSDRELIASAKWHIRADKITSRRGLSEADTGLYQALMTRGLLDEIGLSKKRGEMRDWTEFERKELISFARKFIVENGIRNRKALEKIDSGLFAALKRRKMLCEIGLPSCRVNWRDWSKMTDTQLIKEAKDFIREKRVDGRRKLEKADLGLYEALQRRKLLNEIGLPDSTMNHRDYSRMSNEGIVAYAKGLFANSGIKSKGELYRKDHPFYETLRRRKLLDIAFSDIESSKHSDAINGVLDALGSFGDGK